MSDSIDNAAGSAGNESTAGMDSGAMGAMGDDFGATGGSYSDAGPGGLDTATTDVAPATPGATDYGMAFSTTGFDVMAAGIALGVIAASGYFGGPVAAGLATANAINNGNVETAASHMASDFSALSQLGSPSLDFGAPAVAGYTTATTDYSATSGEPGSVAGGSVGDLFYVLPTTVSDSGAGSG
jgi:hypothetical protein